MIDDNGKRLAYAAGLFRGAVENGRSFKDGGITYVLLDHRVCQNLVDFLDCSTSSTDKARSESEKSK